MHLTDKIQEAHSVNLQQQLNQLNFPFLCSMLFYLSIHSDDPDDRLRFRLRFHPQPQKDVCIFCMHSSKLVSFIFKFLDSIEYTRVLSNFQGTHVCLFTLRVRRQRCMDIFLHSVFPVLLFECLGQLLLMLKFPKRKDFI